MTPRIVYIMGTGRSGSTVLEVLLGAAPGAFGAGELTHLPRDAFLRDRRCSCGEPASACAVWSAVRRAVGWSTSRTEAVATLFESAAHHRRVPGLLLGAVAPDLVAANDELVAAIADVTGASVVIDSSKYVARALALRPTPDLTVVALTRDPAGLMASWQKPNRDEQPPKSPTQVLAYYSYVATSVRLAAASLAAPRFTLDALTADPEVELTRLAGATGLDLDQVRTRVLSGGEFPVGHVVSGNRLRHRGSVRFDPAAAPSRPTGRRAGLAVAAMRIQRALLGL